ncbi:uracil-DNA glycosylase family protein [Bradyrhizobium embrapense]
MEHLTEKHPFNCLEAIPDNASTLIVGTAPPPRFSRPDMCLLTGDTRFYYGSKSNRMWRLLSGITGTPLLEEPDDAQRRTNWRNFLTVNDLWMFDVLQEYKRKSGKETSARDADIEAFDLTDFRRVFAAKRRINKIAFTSQQAADWTFRKLSDSASQLDARYRAAISRRNEIGKHLQSDHERIAQKFRGPILSEYIEGREIAFYILPTPTRMSGGMKGLNSKTKEKIYADVLMAMRAPR